jgi:RNA polymerase sigma-70 factor (sigma-E family)
MKVAEGLMTFEEWVGARGGALLRFALMVTADPGHAEDVTQTVLARAYRIWDRIDAPEAYLKRMVVNEHLKRWRRRSSREVPFDAPADAATTSDATDALASRDAAWKLLQRLPRRQRAVLALRYYEDMSDDAIATTLGCTASTVRSQAARALATLRVVGAVQPEALP